MSTIFFHDLQCRSGFGDRLLDLWAARTIATLHDPQSLLCVRWHVACQSVAFLRHRRYIKGLELLVVLGLREQHVIHGRHDPARLVQDDVHRMSALVKRSPTR